MSDPQLEYSGPIIQGGNPYHNVSPNFRLREFLGADGEIRVHEELVSSLQILRDGYGKPIRIVKMMATDGQEPGPRGTYAWISSALPAALKAFADNYAMAGYFTTVRLEGESVFVRLDTEQPLRPVTLEDALETAIQVTAGFETAGDPFQEITGNFDGAGISFGPIQANFKSGSLPLLFKKMLAGNGPALEACFEADFGFWVSMLHRPLEEQMAWADEISEGSDKREICSPWRGYFEAVGRYPDFRMIMAEQAKTVYGKALGVAIERLQKNTSITIDHLRCFCALFDLCVQQGDLKKALDPIRKRVEIERPSNQFDLVRIAVEERAHKASPRWRADCLSRRLGILNREPTQVKEGKNKACRENPRFYLLRDVTVRGIPRLME